MNTILSFEEFLEEMNVTLRSVERSSGSRSTVKGDLESGHHSPESATKTHKSLTSQGYAKTSSSVEGRGTKNPITYHNYTHPETKKKVQVVVSGEHKIS